MRGLLFIIAVLAFATGCKKPVDEPAPLEMPERTEKGANILACRVNGDVHIYRDKMSSVIHDGVNFLNISDPIKFILIRADETDYDDNIQIKLYSPQIKLDSSYNFSSQDSKDLAQYFTGQGYDEDTYTTSDGSGSVSFSRFDSTVVAGTFSFSAYNPAGEKVEITDGFFDISLQ